MSSSKSPDVCAAVLKYYGKPPLSELHSSTSNPLDSVLENIDNVNYDCYNLCSTFENTFHQDRILKSECGKNCKACVASLVYAKGKTPCSLRIPPPMIETRPQFWGNCMKMTGGDIQKAYECCMNSCDGVLDPENCKKYCWMTANSYPENQAVVSSPTAAPSESEGGTSDMWIYTPVVAAVLLIVLYLVKRYSN